jgi:hypothetical protein
MVSAKWEELEYGGFLSHGGTPKWMVYNEKSYEHNMDDLGVP